MVDLEMSDDAQLDQPYPIAMSNRLRYPPGLCICLCEEELEKLGLEADCEVGDAIHINAMAFVTSVHKSENNSRVELQIKYMAVEDEQSEVEDEDD